MNKNKNYYCFFRFVLLSLFLSFSFVAVGDDSKEKLREKISKLFSQGNNNNIDSHEVRLIDSEMPYFYIISYQGDFSFISKDGKYYLEGNAWNIDEMKNLTSDLKKEFHLSEIKKLNKNIPIVFKSKNEETIIWVLTDIECIYCQRLHSEINQLNDLGVSVNYISFPRSGNKSNLDWQKAEAVWCALDRKEAMTLAKKRGSLFHLPRRENCHAQIDVQYQLVRRLGGRATPTIIYGNGTKTEGYMQAKELASMAIFNAAP